MKLHDQLESIARVPVLLVASDYDGTLAPIVEDPSQAHPVNEAITALRNLSELPSTHVAVISGRALRDLRTLASFPSGVHLVGSHGSEFDADFGKSLAPNEAELLDQIRNVLREVAQSTDKARLEEKPASIAFHYRQVEPAVAERALETIEERLGSIEGVTVRQGKKVLELDVIETNKADALQAIRNRLGATHVLFVGDDVTDEAAFQVLRPSDLSIKVGEGDTSARQRLSDPQEVAEFLARLSELRERWLVGEQFAPIEEHSFLSDQRSGALVAPGGRVVWMCAPRLDAPALFSEIIGGPVAGRFVVRPTEDTAPGRQQYIRQALALRTQWTDVELIDFFDASPGRTRQRPGNSDLVRIVRGQGMVDLEFAPRLDFGRVHTLLRQDAEGLTVEDSVEPVRLLSPGVTWDIQNEGPHHVARARVELGREPLVLELRVGALNSKVSFEHSLDRLDRTCDYWRTWCEQLTFPNLARELTMTSALVLKGLCHGPTGAIAAAPTTSLPECIGGPRNWDYRYCWIRDASMAADALAQLGSYSEGVEFLDWLLDLLDRHGSLDGCQPMYSLTGDPIPYEAEISELSGYRNSRPVRIGNAAYQQLQLDTFGPVADLVWRLFQNGAPLSSQHWRLVSALVGLISRRWREPDHGIWEVRTRRRHYVHSKIMCWVTMDRACKLAAYHLPQVPREWQALRDEIHADVLQQGWDEKAGAFVMSYGGSGLDAAVLEIGLRGMLPPDDPRLQSTLAAVQRELQVDHTIRRYRTDDGLSGHEGSFLLCSSWVVRLLALSGRRDEALAVFDALCARAGTTGLLPEEYDPATDTGLGNHPQAYSHIAVIESALALQETAPGNGNGAPGNGGAAV